MQLWYIFARIYYFSTYFAWTSQAKSTRAKIYQNWIIAFFMKMLRRFRIRGASTPISYAFSDYFQFLKNMFFEGVGQKMSSLIDR